MITARGYSTSFCRLDSRAMRPKDLSYSSLTALEALSSKMCVPLPFPFPKRRGRLIHAILLKALSKSHYQGIEKDGDATLATIKRSTKGVLFAGTPHRGADKAKWASIAGNLASFLQIDHSGQMIESLKRGDQVLERLQDRFKWILRSFALYTLYEESEYPRIGKVRVFMRGTERRILWAEQRHRLSRKIPQSSVIVMKKNTPCMAIILP